MTGRGDVGDPLAFCLVPLSVRDYSSRQSKIGVPIVSGEEESDLSIFNAVLLTFPLLDQAMLPTENSPSGE
jgi:hypothetical protein